MGNKNNDIKIISRGAEDVSVSKVTIRYLVNGLGVVDTIQEHPYDINLNNIGLYHSFDDENDINAIRKALLNNKIYTIDRVYDLKIVDFEDTALSIEDPLQTDNSDSKITAYRQFDKLIASCNSFIEYDKKKEAENIESWHNFYQLNNKKYEDNLVKNKTKFTKINSLKLSIYGAIKKIQRIVSKENVSNNQRYKMILYCYNFANKNLSISGTKHITNFGEGLFKKIGFYLSEDIDYNRINDEIYLKNMLIYYLNYFSIFYHYLSKALNYFKDNNCKTINDAFNTDEYQLKILILNSFNEIFDTYEDANIYNLYYFYEYFRNFIEFKINDIIQNYILTMKRIDDVSQYLPLPSILLCFGISIYLSTLYNFTLLKEIWERNNLAGIYVCIFIFAIVIVFNLIRNIKNKKKNINSENEIVQQTCSIRKGTSIASISMYFVITVILFSLNIFYIFRYDGYDDKFYYVDYANDTIIIDGLRDEKDSYYIVPNSIDGYQVYDISDLVFKNNSNIIYLDMSNYNGILRDEYLSNCENLQVVHMPSAKKVPNGYLKDCLNLKYVYLKPETKNIGVSAFENCKELYSININLIEEVGNNAFNDCINLAIDDVSNLIVIGEKSFRNTKVMNIVLNDNIVEIPESAFENCKDLYIDDLPAALETIGKNAFDGCSSINSLHFDSNLKNIGDGAFNKCTGLVSLSLDNVEMLQNQTIAKIFGEGKNNIRSIIINNAPVLFDHLFEGCTGLESFKVNGSVNKIGEFAFKGCNKLSHFDILTASIHIGQSSFEACNNLEQLSFISNIMDEIPDKAFYNCSLNEDVVFNDSINTIGNYAFFNNKIGNVKFSSNIKEINDNAFNGCELTTLDIPNSLNNIGKCSFENNNISKLSFHYNVNDNTINYIFGKDIVKLQSIKYIDAPEIRNSMFKDCSSLTKLVLTQNPLSIGEHSFENTSNLPLLNYFKKLSIVPQFAFYNSNAIQDFNNQFGELTYIGDSAFCNCPINSSISMPSSLIEIGSSAFMYCTLISDITLNENLQKIGLNAFNSCAKNGVLSLFDNIKYINNLMEGNEFKTLNIVINNGKKSLSNILNINEPTQFKEIYCDYKINSIAPYMFSNCNQTSKIVINGSTISNIGDYAFDNCLQLTDLSFNHGDLTIGKYAFNKCSYLSEFSFISSIKECIPDYAFAYCGLNSVNLDNSIVCIGDSAFLGCNLLDITFPTNLTIIGDYAFCNNKLSLIDIPDSVTFVGGNSFMGNSITEFNFSSNNNIKSIDKLFGPDVVKITTVTYKTFDNEIDEMFRDCQSLSTLNLLGNPIIIGRDAFKNCYNLKVINNLENVVRVEAYGFYNCPAITKLEGQFVDLQYIGDYAFYGCPILDELVLPSGVSEVGTSSFEGCNHITKLVINENIKKIGENAFANCTLLNTLTLFDSICDVSNICQYNTFDILNLNIVNGTKTINDIFNNFANSFTTINLFGLENNIIQGMFEGCDTVEQLNIGNSIITKIGDRAFKDCNNLREISFNPGELQIGNASFENCYNLETLDFIPNIIGEIPNDAFVACYQLDNLNLSNSVTKIGDKAFYYTPINSLPDLSNINSVGQNAFSKTNITSLHIPNNVINIGLNAFDNRISELTIDYCNDAYTINYLLGGNANYVTTVNINGYDHVPNDMFYGCTNLKKVLSNTDILNIGNNAFYACLELLEIPCLNMVKTVGDKAFYNTSIITDINTQMESLENIGEYAFAYCSFNSSIVLPNNVNNIGAYAFYGNNGIKSLTINQSIENMDSTSFACCNELVELFITDQVSGIGSIVNDNLQNITISLIDYSKTMNDIFGNQKEFLNNVTILNFKGIIIDNMFAFCNDLYNVSFDGSTITSIGNNAFSNCGKLSSLDLSNVTSIGNEAFIDCNLSNVTFSNELTFIGDSAFKNNSLLSVDIPESVAYIGQCAFYSNIIDEISMPLANTKKILDHFNSNEYHMDIKLLNTTEIPAGYFEGIGVLNEFDFTNITKIGDFAFKETGLYDINLSSVNEIGKAAFQKCTSLTSVKGYKLNYVSMDAFCECINLSSIDIEGVVNTIGDNAFYNCSHLLNNQFKDLERVGSKSFYNCYFVYASLSPDVSYVGEYAFYGAELENGVSLTNPEAYICENAFAKSKICTNEDGYNIVISQNFDNNIDYYFGTLDQSLIIKIVDVSRINKEYFASLKNASEIIINGTADKVENNTFEEFILNRIILPNSVTKIGDNAFKGCQNLNKIILPIGLKSIGKKAFNGSGLTEVTLPYDVEYIGNKAFEYNTIVNNADEKHQKYLYDWNMDWDSNSNFDRFVDYMDHMRKVKPVDYYCIVGAIIIALLLLIITSIVVPIVKRKKKKLLEMEETDSEDGENNEDSEEIDDEEIENE